MKSPPPSLYSVFDSGRRITRWLTRCGSGYIPLFSILLIPHDTNLFVWRGLQPSLREISLPLRLDCICTLSFCGSGCPRSSLVPTSLAMNIELHLICSSHQRFKRSNWQYNLKILVQCIQLLFQFAAAIQLFLGAVYGRYQAACLSHNI